LSNIPLFHSSSVCHPLSIMLSSFSLIFCRFPDSQKPLSYQRYWFTVTLTQWYPDSVTPLTQWHSLLDETPWLIGTLNWMTSAD
jgi:hypothetical protein